VKLWALDKRVSQKPGGSPVKISFWGYFLNARSGGALLITDVAFGCSRAFLEIWNIFPGGHKFIWIPPRDITLGL